MRSPNVHESGEKKSEIGRKCIEANPKLRIEYSFKISY
jgi:hypothetical protein